MQDSSKLSKRAHGRGKVFLTLAFHLELQNRAQEAVLAFEVDHLILRAVSVGSHNDDLLPVIYSNVTFNILLYSLLDESSVKEVLSNESG